MKEYWARYAAFVDGKSERERIILMLVLLVIILVICDALLLGGLLDKRQMRAKALASVERDTGTLQLEIKNLQLSQSAEGSAGRQQKNEYSQTLSRLEQAVSEAAEGFIPANAMPLALEEILESSKKLALVSLQNKPVELVSGKLAAGADQLYRHGVQMKMKGSYVAAMEYLKQIEQLSWRIDWHAMSFEVVHYPEGLLTIDVFTYSNEKDWISV